MEASRKLRVPGYIMQNEDVREFINTGDINIVEVIEDKDFEERDGEPADEVGKGNLTTANRSISTR